MPHGRYPAALVFIDVAPRDVDVNVHPAKAEVRLADARAAHEAIGAALRPALASGAWLPLDGTAGVGPARSYTIAPADDRSTRVAEALQRYRERAPYERPRWHGEAGSTAGVPPMSEGPASWRAGAESARAADPGREQAPPIPPPPDLARLRSLGPPHPT